MRRSTIAIIIALIIIIAGITVAVTHNNNSTPTTTSNSSTSQSSKSASQTSTSSVDIRDMMFTPSQITVAKGTTVTWTNNDSVTHTVHDDLSNVGGPASGDIKPGATYSFTFNKTGSFQYHCTIHSSMRGTIVVK